VPKKVLVADDEPFTAEMLALMLAFRGFDVVLAHDGQEALQRLRADRPDAALLDVYMPVLEGVDVTRELRADPELAGVPVMLISSADEGEVEWQAAGANMFVQKPLDIRTLPELVETLLDPPPDGDRRAA
jgi:CheY-like chemotaxis protein